MGSSKNETITKHKRYGTKKLKKKYKDKKFAAGCSREIIDNGANTLGWELDELLQRTLEAMQEMEDEIQKSVKQHIN